MKVTILTLFDDLHEEDESDAVLIIAGLAVLPSNATAAHTATNATPILCDNM